MNTKTADIMSTEFHRTDEGHAWAYIPQDDCTAEEKATKRKNADEKFAALWLKVFGTPYEEPKKDKKKDRSFTGAA